jgi:hypothetical protein
MASPTDGHCGNSRPELCGQHYRVCLQALEQGVRPRRIEDEEKGLLQRLHKPYSDLTVVYIVRKRREGSIGRYNGRVRFRR